jgi:hypothetical protein
MHTLYNLGRGAIEYFQQKGFPPQSLKALVQAGFASEEDIRCPEGAARSLGQLAQYVYAPGAWTSLRDPVLTEDSRCHPEGAGLPAVRHSWFSDGSLFESIQERERLVEYALSNATEHESGPVRRGPFLLLLAASCGQSGVVRSLLEHGACATLRDDRERSALHYAAEQGFEQAVELLLAHGADRNGQDVQGQTPLDLALQRGHDSVAAVLRQYHRGSE